MDNSITIQQALAYVGTDDIDWLTHGIGRISDPPPPVWTDDGRLDVTVWDEIKDKVKEYVDLRKRGGVHALPGGQERIETDEEFAYNSRIERFVRRQQDAGKYRSETLDQRLAAINIARQNVLIGESGAVDDLAALNFRLWGKPPWQTRQDVFAGTENLEAVH